MCADDQLAALTARFGVQDLTTRGVLLVDDEPLNLKVLKSLLEDDYTVYQAASGAEALALVEKTPLDVVIADQRRPEMTGTELLGRLRAVRPDVGGILLTGFADQRTAESAINQAGALRFLRKPFDPDELSCSLEQVRASQEQVLHLERLGTMGQLASVVLHDLRNVVVSLRAVELEIAQTATAPGGDGSSSTCSPTRSSSPSRAAASRCASPRSAGRTARAGCRSVPFSQA
jgi:response regulator RpfG family c-di-GMP phosphodiesterase